MIRSIKEHYDLIVATKESKSTLPGLLPINDSSEQFINDSQSGSVTAVWRRFAWLFAVHAWMMDVLFDAHKRDIDDKLNNQVFASPRWYKEITLAFQYGYGLEWNGTKYVYSDTNSQAALDAQIVERCAVVQVETQLQFKVAKLDGDVPSKLLQAEKDALYDYLIDLAYPGTNVVVISEDADELRFNLVVYYDPQVMANDGSLIVDPSVFPVKEAISGYIQNLDWNGRVYESKAMDQVQASTGVVDFELLEMQVKYGELAYSDMGRFYIPFAGHMVIDEANSNITYIAAT